nr:WYL domain-containing protein [Streptomyces graminilatus]
MESLAAAGVPLYGDPGHDGGYRLVDGYRTRLTGLTGEEAEALSLAGLPGPAADLGLGTVLAAAQLKLRAALPDELRDRTGEIRQRFHLDTSGWYAETDATPHLAAVTDFDARRHQGDAVVRLSPRILEQLPDLMEPAVARAARNSAGPPGPDGRVQVVIPTESVDHAVGMLLRLGAEAEVVAPLELRARMAQTIAALADTYRRPPTAQ